MAKVLVEIPDELLKKMDELVDKEYNNRNELIRQACRNIVKDYEER